MGGHVGHVVNNWRTGDCFESGGTNLPARPIWPISAFKSSRQQGIEKSVNSTTDVAAEMIETLGCEGSGHDESLSWADSLRRKSPQVPWILGELIRIHTDFFSKGSVNVISLYCFEHLALPLIGLDTKSQQLAARCLLAKESWRVKF